MLDDLDINAELAILESKLGWPDAGTLRVYYRKLLENPGSAVIMALQAPRGPEGPTWGLAWFSSKERNALASAILRINKSRARRHQQPTSELPK